MAIRTLNDLNDLLFPPSKRHHLFLNNVRGVIDLPHERAVCRGPLLEYVRRPSVLFERDDA